MAAFILDSLVLRDVAVVDALVVDVRLGAGLDMPQTPENCNSLRHPLSSRQPGNGTSKEPDEGNTSSGLLPGAGRSRRSSGSSSSWRATTSRVYPTCYTGISFASRTPPAAKRGKV